jgi:hypothetical protein
MDGDWWLLKEYNVASTARSTAYNLKPGGRYAHHVPDGQWEFKSGAIPNTTPKKYGVWVRYLTNTGQ